MRIKKEGRLHWGFFGGGFGFFLFCLFVFVIFFNGFGVLGGVFFRFCGVFCLIFFLFVFCLFGFL